MSLLALVLLLIVTVILVLVIYDYAQTISLQKKTRHLQGPKRLPFLGNIYDLMGNIEDLLVHVERIASLYKSPVKIWLGTRLIFGLTDVEHIKAVLLSPKAIEKEDFYKFSKPWLGTGLFTADGHKWRIHRKLIMPTFNLKILESFVDIFAKQSNILVDSMEAELDGKEFQVFDYLSRCTLDFICESAMGIHINAQKNKDNPFLKSSQTTLAIMCKRILQIWLHPDIIFNNTTLGKTQQKHIKYLHGVTDDVIQKKKLIMSSDESKDNFSNADNKQKSFLDLLMELMKDGNRLTDQELREEVNTMLLAGSDTTAITNMFTFLMLASHPEIQEKVYDEIYEIYGSSDPKLHPVKHEDLQHMNYLERVIKESLRLFPVGPMIFRRLTEDLLLDDGNVLPKGSSAAIIIYMVHRNKKYWPDPLKFDPDRFLPENSSKRHPYTFIPFSGGPRNCLGMRYAMMSMKVLIATILRKYILKKDEVTPIKDIKVKLEIMIRPIKPVTIRIEKRPLK